MVHRIAACLVGGGLLFSQASTTKSQVTFSPGNSPAGPRVTVGQPSGYGYGNPYYGQPGVYGNPGSYQPGYAQPYAPHPVRNSDNSGYQGYYGQPAAPYSGIVPIWAETVDFKLTLWNTRSKRLDRVGVDLKSGIADRIHTQEAHPCSRYRSRPGSPMPQRA